MDGSKNFRANLRRMQERLSKSMRIVGITTNHTESFWPCYNHDYIFFNRNSIHITSYYQSASSQIKGK